MSPSCPLSLLGPLTRDVLRRMRDAGDLKRFEE